MPGSVVSGSGPGLRKVEAGEPGFASRALRSLCLVRSGDDFHLDQGTSRMVWLGAVADGRQVLRHSWVVHEDGTGTLWLWGDKRQTQATYLPSGGKASLQCNR